METKVQISLWEPWPYEVFAERWEGLFLVVTEHLEDDGLSFDVLHKGLGHLHCDLMGKRETLWIKDLSIRKKHIVIDK